MRMIRMPFVIVLERLHKVHGDAFDFLDCFIISAHIVDGTFQGWLHPAIILYAARVMLPTYWFSVWWCFWGAPVASVSISCPSCSATDGVVRNGKSTAGHQRYLCSHCRKTWQLQFTYTASQPGTHQKIIDMAMNGVGCRATARIMGVGLNTILRHLKNSGRSR